MKKKIGFANVMLAAASLCLSLIAAELVLRSFVPSDPRRPFEFRVPHPELGWVLQPNASYVYDVPEGKVPVSYNSQGWRDVEHSYEKPDGVFRILVLGDSFVEANSVKFEDIFSTQVEKLARPTGRNVEVINMGVAGYGTLQEYLVFRDIGYLYNPDLVLVGFFDENDVVNNSLELASILTNDGQMANARPFLDLNEPIWTITPVDFDGAQRSYETHKAELEAGRNKLTGKLVLLRFVTDAIERIRVPAFLRGPESQTETIDRSRYELALLGVNYCDESAEFTRAWGGTARIFAKLKEEVDAHGGTLVVFTVPAKEEVDWEYMQAVRADVTYPDKLCLEQAPGHTRLGQILKDLNIQEIALLPDFRKATNEDGLNLYMNDLHWSREGHALAAERAVSELIQRGLLPAPNP